MMLADTETIEIGWRLFSSLMVIGLFVCICVAISVGAGKDIDNDR